GLDRVGEPGAVVIALRRDVHLRLVLEAAERLAVHDPVAVALERCAHRRVLLVQLAPRRVGALGERREELVLDRRDPVPEGRRTGVGGGHGAILPRGSERSAAPGPPLPPLLPPV